jgi:hypothetical protein
MRAVKQTTRALSRANSLPFWMSPVPALSVVSGDASFSPRAMATYGSVLFADVVAFAIARTEGCSLSGLRRIARAIPAT